MNLDIIMLNWNKLSLLQMCLETLYQHTDYPFHLIIVDNASTDGSVEFLKTLDTLYPDVTVHFCPYETSGFNEGNNMGLHYSDGDAVLLLNNDVLIPRVGWLHAMVKTLFTEDVGIVGCKLLYPNELIQHAGVWFNEKLQSFHIGRFQSKEKYSTMREVPAVTFACALIKKELLRFGLDEGYWAGTFEDLDFCTQARSMGYKILYCPDATLYHYESATSLSLPSTFWHSITIRNATKFLNRWGSWLMQDMTFNPELYKEKREE